MELKDQLIHDICVLQERINFYNANRPGLVDEITKLENRQRKAVDTYLYEVLPDIRTTEWLLKWANKIGATYDGKNTNFTELDEAGHGFEPRRVDPIAVERCPICGDLLKHLGFEKGTGNSYGCGTCKTVFTGY